MHICKNGKKFIYRKYLKRPMDIIAALFAITILSPVFLIIVILIRLKLGSPVIFKQKRPGLNERIFTLYKFRTMTEDKDRNGNLLSDKERVTDFGRKLRFTSLDELPELINIIKGDMSFVGPRPLLVRYLPLYNKTQRKRHYARPGLTGIAQISGRNILSWEKKFTLDIEYVDTVNFLLDIKIIMKTILQVIRRKGIIDLSNKMESFNGNNKLG